MTAPKKHPPTDPIRQRFPVGTRVQVRQPSAITGLGTGVVVGYSREAGFVRVRWDGAGTVQQWNAEGIEEVGA